MGAVNLIEQKIGVNMAGNRTKHILIQQHLRLRLRHRQPISDSLVYAQIKSSVELFQQQAALGFTSVSGIGADPTVAKDLGDRAMFLSHMTPFYPKQ